MSLQTKALLIFLISFNSLIPIKSDTSASYPPLFYNDDTKFLITQGAENSAFGFSTSITSNKKYQILIGSPRKNQLPLSSLTDFTLANNFLGQVDTCKVEKRQGKNRIICDQFLDYGSNQNADFNFTDSYSTSVPQTTGVLKIQNRLLGLNIKYNEISDTLLVCAPGSFSEYFTIIDNGSYIAEGSRYPKKTKSKNAFGRCVLNENFSKTKSELSLSRTAKNLVRNPRDDLQMFYSSAKQKNNIQKIFGFQSQLLDDGHVLTTSPGANYWMGSFQYDKVSDTNAKELINFKDTKNQLLYRIIKDGNDLRELTQAEARNNLKKIFSDGRINYVQTDEPNYRLGTRVKSLICDNPSLPMRDRRFVITSGTDPEGLIVIYEIIKDQETNKYTVAQEYFTNYLKSEEPEFGTKFGFSFDTFKIKNENYLLVSSPYGNFGKLELFKITCPAVDFKSSKLKITPANDKLIGAPTNIKNLGYTIETVGNIDPAEGDEVLVSAPKKQNGEVYVFSVRGDELKMIQKIGTGVGFG